MTDALLLIFLTIGVATAFIVLVLSVRYYVLVFVGWVRYRAAHRRAKLADRQGAHHTLRKVWAPDERGWPLD